MQSFLCDYPVTPAFINTNFKRPSFESGYDTYLLHSALMQRSGPSDTFIKRIELFGHALSLDLGRPSLPVSVTQYACIVLFGHSMPEVHVDHISNLTCAARNVHRCMAEMRILFFPYVSNPVTLVKLPYAYKTRAYSFMSLFCTALSSKKARDSMDTIRTELLLPVVCSAADDSRQAKKAKRLNSSESDNTSQADDSTYAYGQCFRALNTIAAGNTVLNPKDEEEVQIFVQKFDVELGIALVACSALTKMPTLSSFEVHRLSLALLRCAGFTSGRYYNAVSEAGLCETQVSEVLYERFCLLGRMLRDRVLCKGSLITVHEDLIHQVMDSAHQYLHAVSVKSAMDLDVRDMRVQYCGLPTPPYARKNYFDFDIRILGDVYAPQLYAARVGGAAAVIQQAPAVVVQAPASVQPAPAVVIQAPASVQPAPAAFDVSVFFATF